MRLIRSREAFEVRVPVRQNPAAAFCVSSAFKSVYAGSLAVHFFCLAFMLTPICRFHLNCSKSSCERHGPIVREAFHGVLALTPEDPCFPENVTVPAVIAMLISCAGFRPLKRQTRSTLRTAVTVVQTIEQSAPCYSRAQWRSNEQGNLPWLLR